jgi:hypothetical protein
MHNPLITCRVTREKRNIFYHGPLKRIGPRLTHQNLEKQTFLSFLPISLDIRGFSQPGQYICKPFPVCLALFTDIFLLIYFWLQCILAYFRWQFERSKVR